MKRRRAKPLCVPLTNSSSTIASFEEVIGLKKTIPGMIPGVSISDGTPVVWTIIKNQGLGPALNVRIHFNDIDNNRITKDFLVSHVLPSENHVNFLSEIPREEFRDLNGGHIMGIEPSEVIQRSYYLVCEYESMFSGEQFHSIVSKGYLDPSLASDGKNQLRLQRPRTPPVIFRDGVDPARPLWPVPQDDGPYPGEFLNRANQGNGNQTL